MRAGVGGSGCLALLVLLGQLRACQSAVGGRTQGPQGDSFFSESKRATEGSLWPTRDAPLSAPALPL